MILAEGGHVGLDVVFVAGVAVMYGLVTLFLMTGNNKKR